MCLLFLKREFQFLCKLHFPGHIGVGVKTKTEEQKQTVIFWVDFPYCAPDTSHARGSRSLAFSALTTEAMPGSCNALLKRQLVSCPAQTPKAGLCSALVHAVSTSQGPYFGKRHSFVSPKSILR